MGQTRKVTNGPNPVTVDIDPERLVRDFLNACTLLEATLKPRETIETAEGPGVNLLSTSSEAASDDAASAPGEISIGVSPDEPDILKRCCLDEELIERLHVTPQELEALSHSSLFGSLASERDVRFMLRMIREGVSSGREVPAGDVQFEMAEDIRRESLRRLGELDLQERVFRRRVWRLLVPGAGVFAATLILLFAMVPRARLAIEAIDWFKVVMFGSILLLARTLTFHLHQRIAMRRFKVRVRRPTLRRRLWEA